MNNIKALREEKGISQDALAYAVGVAQQAVAKWESGKSNPRADRLPAIAKYLDCTVDELLVRH